jgi:methanogenic corrinoid protein MtbC1
MSQRRENDSREELVGKISRAYAEALLVGDEVAAEIAVREAIDVGLTPAEIDDEIIAPGLWLIGERWERREISVADEHLATEITLRVLALHREAHRVASGRSSHRVLLATPSGELHAVALKMVSNLLRDAAYEVLMLGADVPAEALAFAARRHSPDVICLSSTMPGGSDEVLIAMHAVLEERPGTPFVVGGRAVTSRVRARQGVDVCQRVSQVVDAVDAMVKRAGLN